MDFTILTLFPDFINQGIHTSILGKACDKGLLSFKAVDIRSYSTDKNNRVDDYTYGGGAGMLMQAQPVFDAYMANCVHEGKKKPRTIYVTPQGRPFTQTIANELSREDELVFICGHYEGIDQRVLDEIVTDRYSIGDYVLTGGELPALVMIDAISRLVPGVLGNDVSADIESFHGNLLEYPQYTRPECWMDKKVPEVLLKGNPKEVEAWRLDKSKELTKRVRPDLYEKYELSLRVIEELSKDKKSNVHLLEAIKRGTGEIISVDPLMIYIPQAGIVFINEGICVDKNQSFESINPEKIFSLLPEKAGIFISTREIFDILEKDERFEFYCDVKNAVYTEKVHKKIKNKNIKQLDKSYIEIIAENYGHGENGYVAKRVERGQVYGIFVEDKLAGFIGTHYEGSIGMLFIFPEYRRMGLGTDLENFMINRELEMGHMPFGQIIMDNDASFALQSKNGLYLGQRVFTWFGLKNK
ncbi:MAG: tRNA (guanosine(37)-N1)-methyltransferase TrmD [Lachnospiraceae bacterium]|nr:tRNA (guanosine(37)-N1)-methyltransferase TrmD [Lachnospiraceae bacterium]